MSKRRDAFLSDWLETRSLLEETRGSRHTTTPEDVESMKSGSTSAARRACKQHATTSGSSTISKHRETIEPVDEDDDDDKDTSTIPEEGGEDSQTEEEEDDERRVRKTKKMAVTQKRKKKTKSQREGAVDEPSVKEEEEEAKTEVFDLRRVYPIDESHAPSVREFGKLSAYMASMGRSLSLQELLGYTTSWFTIGHALVKVNDQAYRSQVMLYNDGVVRCTCFLFETIKALHECAYGVLRHCVEHLRSSLVNTETVCLLPVMNDATTALSRGDLKVMLLVLIELCRTALTVFHPSWKDFANSLNTTIEDVEIREATLARYSARHTGALGTLASHLLQVHAVVAFWEHRTQLPAAKTLQLAWETASVLAQLKEDVVVASLQYRFPYAELLLQLRVMCYKRLAQSAVSASRWSHVAWFCGHVAALHPGDQNNHELLQTAIHNATQICNEPLISPQDTEPIMDLHKRAATKRAITTEQIAAMEPNALSTVYRERAYDDPTRPHHLTLQLLKWPEIRLRVV